METNFGDFPNLDENCKINTRLDDNATTTGLAQADSSPDEILTGADLESTEPHQNDDFEMTEETYPDRLIDPIDDRQSSGGSDTIVPEVLDDESDDLIVDNKSPRRGEYNLRPNPTPNLLMNTDTSQIFELQPRF